MSKTKKDIDARLLEMMKNNYCAECDRLVTYNHNRINCFVQSPLDPKRCGNFEPNKDKI